MVEIVPSHNHPDERIQRIIEFPFGFINSSPEENAAVRQAMAQAERLDRIQSQNFCQNVETMSIKALFMKEADRRISLLEASVKQRMNSTAQEIKNSLNRKIDSVNICDEKVLRVMSQRFHNYMADLTRFAEWITDLAAVNDKISSDYAYKLIDHYVKINPFDKYEDSKVVLPYPRGEFPPWLQIIDAKSQDLQLDSGEIIYSSGSRIRDIMENLIVDYDFPGIFSGDAQSKAAFCNRFIFLMITHPGFRKFDAKKMLVLMRESAAQLKIHAPDKSVEKSDYDKIIAGVQAAVFGSIYLPREDSSPRPAVTPERGKNRSKIIVPGEPLAVESENNNRGQIRTNRSQTSRPSHYRPGMDTMRSNEDIETADYKFKITPPLPTEENWADSVYNKFNEKGFAERQNMNFVDAGSEIVSAKKGQKIHTVEGNATGGEFVFPMPRTYTIDSYSFSPDLGAKLQVDKKSGIYSFKWTDNLTQIVSVKVQIYENQRILNISPASEEVQKFLGQFNNKPNVGRPAANTPHGISNKANDIRRYILSNFRYPANDADTGLIRVYQNSSNYFEALEQHKVADCDIANMYLVGLLREAGIPARLVAGDVAESKVGLRPHGWAEFFDGKAWIEIDATPSRKPWRLGYKIPDSVEREDAPRDSEEFPEQKQKPKEGDEILEDIFKKLRTTPDLKWALKQLKENKLVISDPEKAVSAILENKKLDLKKEHLLILLTFLFRHTKSTKLIDEIFKRAANQRDFMSYIVWNLRLIFWPKSKVTKKDLEQFKKFLSTQSLATLFDSILASQVRTNPGHFTFVAQ